jgi:hypothetical protein
MSSAAAVAEHLLRLRIQQGYTASRIYSNNAVRRGLEQNTKMFIRMRTGEHNKPRSVASL